MNTENLEKLGVNIVYGNILDYDSLLPATKEIDKVIHAVGVIHPKKAKDFYRINTGGTKNMLEASFKNKVKKFLYISSNSAQGYNIDRVKPMTEEGPERPYTDYGKSKWKAEQKCIHHGEKWSPTGKKKVKNKINFSKNSFPYNNPLKKCIYQDGRIENPGEEGDLKPSKINFQVKPYLRRLSFPTEKFKKYCLK